MRRAYAMALAALLAGALACNRQSEATVTTTHPSNGLRLSLPESLPVAGVPQRLTVTATDVGFQVTLGGEAVRRVAIEANVARRGGAAPPGVWPSEREVGDRRIHFRIDRAEGGSGGTQIDFHAWEACAGGHLEYAQGDLVEEPGEPDFSLVWSVIVGTQPPH
jgi:hypothetical protein